jgi:hypothetical protein
MMGISRRIALSLTGGALVSSAIGYGIVRSFSDEDLVRATLSKYLGDFEMSEADLGAFVGEFKKRHPWIFPTAMLADASTLLETLHLGTTARRLLPGADAQELDRFERWLLADFHVLTDYAWHGAPNESVQFTGFQPCANPFARFESA